MSILCEQRPETDQKLIASLKEWTLTDDDFHQWRRMLDNNGTKFELFQVTQIGSTYCVSHSVIDFETYDENDFDEVLDMYGMTDEELPTTVERNALIAEMLFEQETLDWESAEASFARFDIACAYINEHIY